MIITKGDASFNTDVLSKDTVDRLLNDGYKEKEEKKKTKK